MEPTANLSGTGVLEFSGGSGHELSETISPLVKVSGYAVVTFAGMELALGRGLTVEVHAAGIVTTQRSCTASLGGKPVYYTLLDFIPIYSKRTLHK